MCKIEGHMKGDYPKTMFCEIFQVKGHLIKENDVC